jgi:ribosomal protein S18 acetylase RimI-like enzyme
MTDPDLRIEWPGADRDGRPPTERLREQVYRVVAAVAGSGGSIGWVGAPPREECDAWLDAVLAAARAGRARLVTVTRAGRIEALGHWARYDGAVLERNAEVRKVMVHPSARGGGLGRTVVRALVDSARGAGVETLVLDVRGNNHGAMTLYESLGFEVWGRLPDFIAVDDERFDRVCYRLDLGRPAGVRRHGGRAEGPGAHAGRERSLGRGTEP